MEIASFFTNFLTVSYIILIISTILVIITDNSNPSRTISWLLILLFMPAVGIILYYIFGYNPRRKTTSADRFEKFKQELFSGVPEDKMVDFEELDYQSKVRPQYHTLVDLLENSNDSYVVEGSEVEIIISGKRKFEALEEDLLNAKHHIHVEYFYFRKDDTGKRIREILMRKAEEGVKVRFIFENIANIDINPKFYYEMRKSGVEVLPFSKRSLPWIRRQLNYRDHRKILVIDGEIGYTGGMNIGDDYSVKWRDTHLRIRGQGVYGLQINFLHIWYESGGKLPADLQHHFPPCPKYTDNLLQIVPEAPDSKWPFLLFSMVNAVEKANDYIYIQTPYFLPSEPLMAALKSAALSGVDVRVMVSRKSDIIFMDPATHSFYDESLQAGIRIYEIQDKFSHAKSMVTDNYLSVIGSANLDTRSLDLSFEINTYMYDAVLALRNFDIFLEDMQGCVEVDPVRWAARPWWKKLIQSIMRLFTPLL